MSGWIKWEKDIEHDPRVIRIVREMKRTCNATALTERAIVTLVCGALVRLWAYADTHIREDDTLDLGMIELDDLVGIESFCSLLPEDWLRQIDEKTVELPGFQSHNGVEARKKALTQKRVETHRKRTSVTTALPDLDQTKTITDRDVETPSLAKPLSDKPQKRPSRRCPPDFAVTDEMRAWVSAECPGVDEARETASFRDYEYRNTKSDWIACWRTWMRKATPKRPANGSARGFKSLN